MSLAPLLGFQYKYFMIISGGFFQKMSVVIEFGEYRCSSDSSGNNDETICALKDLSSAETGQSMAPVFLVIDFGDGSGQQIWHREDTKDIWSHQYQLPGRYWVMVSGKNSL